MALILFVVGAVVLAALTALLFLALERVATWRSDALSLARTRTATLEAVRQIDQVAWDHQQAMYRAVRDVASAGL